MNKYDMTGKKIGWLTVLESAGRNKHRDLLWKCQCKCGTIKIIRGFHLRRLEILSCGCLIRQSNTREGGRRNIKGMTFGKLTVIKLDHVSDKEKYWLCQCECGQTVIASTYGLYRKTVTSCGCEASDHIDWFEKNSALFIEQPQ